MGLDPFSSTEPHHRWVTDEWRSEIALAELFRAFGDGAYGLYATVVGGLCAYLRRRHLRKAGVEDPDYQEAHKKFYFAVAAYVLTIVIGLYIPKLAIFLYCQWPG
jgi:hypothetical protein